MFRGLLVGVVVVGLPLGCNPKRDRDEFRQLREEIEEREDSAAAARRLTQRLEDELRRATPADPDPVIPTPTIPIPTPKPTTQPRPTNCVDIGTVTSIKMRGTKLRACVDSNSDGEPDQCVMWERATAKLVTVEQIFSVEDDDTPTPAVVDPDADDPRITQDGETIEACPPERVCLKFMPALAEGETIDGTRGDSRHRSVAMVMSDTDSKNPRTEVWDLAQGRVRGRTKLALLEDDVEYTYAMKSFGDSFVALAKRTDNDDAIATLLGLDGSRRGHLAGGSRFVDSDQMFELAPGQLAVLDLAPPEQPYNIYVHNLATGGTVAKFVVPIDNDGDDDVQLSKMDRNTLGVAQWTSRLKLDLLDVRTSTIRGFTVPGC